MERNTKMKRYWVRTISLAIAMLWIGFSLAACAGTGKTENSTSNSEAGGLLGGSPSANNKPGDELISIEEKYNLAAEGMLGAAGDEIDQYNGYLGYGYNILTAAFYNHKDIKTGHPVVDMNALASNDHVRIESAASQHVDSVTYVSSSAKEYSEHFAAAANVKARIGFTGSFKASFKMDHTTQMKSNQKLITTQALLETQNDYILDVDAKLLADNATSAFKTAAAEKTPEELIELYGTHVLANITLGGRFDINYLYTSTATSESTDLYLSATASFRNISGSAEATDATDRKEIETNSQLFVKTYGGSVTVDPTSVTAAMNSYKEWSSGVENGKITFVNASEVIPIWEIVARISDLEDAADKSAAIKQYFDERVDQISNEFKETVNAEIFISDVYVGYGKTQSEAKNMLRGKGVTEGHIVNLDLNASVGGYWIYLGYKTTADPTKAITGLISNYYGDAKTSNLSYNGIQYTIIPVDLNKGASGEFIYLYYTRDTKAGSPLTMIQYQQNETFQFPDIKADGYHPVIATADGHVADLNKGAGGDYLYLWFK